MIRLVSVFSPFIEGLYLRYHLLSSSFLLLVKARFELVTQFGNTRYLTLMNAQLWVHFAKVQINWGDHYILFKNYIYSFCQFFRIDNNKRSSPNLLAFSIFTAFSNESDEVLAYFLLNRLLKNPIGI